MICPIEETNENKCSDAAIFPRLSVNDPKVRTARREGMPAGEYAALESITRNHYSTISTTWSNIGFLLISLILIGVFQGLAKMWGIDANSLPNYSYVYGLGTVTTLFYFIN